MTKRVPRLLPPGKALLVFSAIAAGSVLLSCGASAPPPPPAAPVAIAAPPLNPPPPGVDLSPVGEPEGTIAIIRIKALDGILGKVRKWTGIPTLTVGAVLKLVGDLGKA